MRDGAFLAVEEINSKGGIKGRKIKLIIKDTLDDLEIAKLNVYEFIKEGVVAVVGPETSTIAKALLSLIDEYKLTFISPTVSSTYFVGKDDYFITLEPNNKKFATVLAQYVNEKLKPKKILIFYDKRNPVYSMDLGENFVSMLKGRISIKWIPIPENDIYVKDVVSFSPDALMLITDVFNASFITQKIKKINPEIKIIICPWARFYGFIENTGYFSEGIISIGFYDENVEDEEYLSFRKKFLRTFGYIPQSAAINGYNAILLIKEALIKGKESSSIKDIIVSLGKFKGLCGEVKINKYGDAETEPFIVIVKENKFIRMK
ncbi:MAG: ABC transporter substrate-binding protein [Thermodesulfovibrionaceae bacterium]